MNNILELQKELINQKNLIESKSGRVNVAGLNPSPYEITEGIKTIESHDLTQSNATEEDVAYGKTFYSGNADLKTGKSLVSKDLINRLLLSDFSVGDGDEIYYELPAGLTYLRKYRFYQNKNALTIKFNEDLKEIEEYSFYKTTNCKFVNLNDLEKLTLIGSSCFEYANVDGIDYGNLPNSITFLGSSCFKDVVQNCLDYRFPNSLKTLSNSAFRRPTRTLANSLDLTNYKLTALSGYTFVNLAFNCDLVVPEGVKSVDLYFNYEGSFKNVILPTTLTSLGTYCFGAATGSAVDNFYMKTITFTNEKIPSVSSNAIANQHVQSGLKIYVPDTVVEEYKAIPNLSHCASVIYPMSEKE